MTFARRPWGPVLACISLAWGCTHHATGPECDALLDKYVELLVREQNPKASDTEIAKQKGVARQKAVGDLSFASCPKEVSSYAASCAMLAPRVDDFEKCLE
ncbi:MAG TPA: hypothetical protein VJT73_09605 [Polyangiaceae bacterium]|nr:hypothetical protein [Polyangiaceae bacterium]